LHEHMACLQSKFYESLRWYQPYFFKLITLFNYVKVHVKWQIYQRESNCIIPFKWMEQIYMRKYNSYIYIFIYFLEHTRQIRLCIYIRSCFSYHLLYFYTNTEAWKKKLIDPQS
jgi:hypothetical protein